jgi:CMP-N-acetylneuraminic acid synthetase/mannose-6-phosphate isomerase-like protein (cupin superfamily)
MIPARAGSSRVKKKCLRYLGDKILVQHVIDICKQVKQFDEIYLNSPDIIFKDIAENSNIKFYERRQWQNIEPETNDDFMSDFLNNIKCDYVIQVNPTSPFITKNTIEDFINFMVNDSVDTGITVKEIHLGCLLNMVPLNFKIDEKLKRTQDLTPLTTYSSCMFGFKRNTFLKAIEKYKSAVNGPIGFTRYYKLNDLESFDIDYEDDFQIAESILEGLKYPKNPRYYNPEEEVEVHVPSIMKKDGVSEFKDSLSTFYNIDEVIEKHLRDESWSERLVNTDSNSATLIYQLPGEGNRFHYHPTWNEWWFILEGDALFTYGENKIETKLHKNDFVLMPKNTWHKVVAIGKKPFIRLAVAREDMPHVYKKDNK